MIIVIIDCGREEVTSGIPEYWNHFLGGKK